MINKVKEKMDKLDDLRYERSQIERLIEKKEAIIEKIFEGNKKENELTSKEEDVYHATVIDICYLKEGLMSNERKFNYIAKVDIEY